MCSQLPNGDIELCEHEACLWLANWLTSTNQWPDLFGLRMHIRAEKEMHHQIIDRQRVILDVFMEFNVILSRLGERVGTLRTWEGLV
jgi:hypothetical protein